jgi:hypothetical protein
MVFFFLIQLLVVVVVGLFQPPSSLLAAAWQSEHVLGECPRIPIPVWDLEGPSVVGSALGVVMEYRLPNNVVDDITYEVFDFDCIQPIPTTEQPPPQQQPQQQPPDPAVGGSLLVQDAPILTELTWGYNDDDDNDDGGTAVLDLEINPTQITNNLYAASSSSSSSLYSETDRTGTESKGDVKLCVRLGLWNAGGILVTFVDTSVSFGVRFLVEPEQKKRMRMRMRRQLVVLPSGGGGGLEVVVVLRNNNRQELTDPAQHTNPITQEEEEEEEDSHNLIINQHKTSTAATTTSTSSRALQAGEASSCKENWGIHIFTCPNTTPNNLSRFTTPMIVETSSDVDPITQGSFIHLCIQLNDDAVRDGAVLFGVSDLTYIRENNSNNNNGVILVQPGVTDNEVSFDGLTQVDCESDTLQMCKIESMLYIVFFSGGGGDGSSGEEDTIILPTPISVEGSVAITSSAFGKRNPLTLDFNLNLEILRAADTETGYGGSSSTRNRGNLWFLYIMVACFSLYYHVDGYYKIK